MISEVSLGTSLCVQKLMMYHVVYTGYVHVFHLTQNSRSCWLCLSNTFIQLTSLNSFQNILCLKERHDDGSYIIIQAMYKLHIILVKNVIHIIIMCITFLTNNYYTMYICAYVPLTGLGLRMSKSGVPHSQSVLCRQMDHIWPQTLSLACVQNNILNILTTISDQSPYPFSPGIRR